MIGKFGSHLRSQWMGALALFLVLSGGTAWAVNEWTGANIVDGSLTSADLKNDNVQGMDIANGTVGVADVGNNAVGATETFLSPDDEIRDGGVGSDDVLDGSLGSADIAVDSLTGADIDEGRMTRVPSAQLADFAERAELAFTAESLDPVEADRLDSDAYGRYRDARFEVPDGVPGGPDVPADDVLTLDLPAGNYFIAAKGIVEAGADVFDPDAVLCRLFADGDSDTGRLFLQHTAPPPAGTALTTTLSMQVLARASQPFTTHLACKDEHDGIQMSHVKLNAFEVGEVTNTAGP